MKIASRKELIILGIFVVIAAVGSFVYVYHWSDVHRTFFPMKFQPEGQMLSQATQPGVTAVADMAATGKTMKAAGGYVYDSKTCANTTSTPYICFAGYYQNLVVTYGVDTAFVDIKTRFAQNGEIQADCHPFMHIIGREAAKIYTTISDAYLHGDSFCWSGYYHGILEGVALKIGKANLPGAINTICVDIPGKETYSFDYYNCVHGIGHGIMELYADDVLSSLTICDRLAGLWEQESCYSGVFMENIISDNLNHNSKYLKTDDLMYPCDAIDAKYKSECYLTQTSYALEKTYYDFTKVSALCTTVAEPYRDICFQSLGRDAANQASHAAAQTQAKCFIATDENDRLNCVVGAVKEMISYYHSDKQANAFCASLDDPYKSTCASTAKAYYSQF